MVDRFREIEGRLADGGSWVQMSDLDLLRFARDEITMLRTELRLALDALRAETQTTELYCEVCCAEPTFADDGETVVEPIDHGRQCPIGRLEALLAERA